MASADSALAPPAPTAPTPPLAAGDSASTPPTSSAPAAGASTPPANPVEAHSPSSQPAPTDGRALALTRADRLFGGLLAIGCLVLLAVHWARLTGWGVQPVEIERHEPRSFEYRLDLNSATWVELALLPEIGEALARSIVEERNQKGPFASVDDLRRVRRIGPKTIEKLRPWVKAESPRPE